MKQINSINNLLEVGEIFGDNIKKKILDDYRNINKYSKNNICFEYEKKYKLLKENDNIFFEHLGKYNIKIRILLYNNETLVKYLSII